MAAPRLSNVRLWAAAAVILALLAIAAAAPILASHDPIDQSLLDQLLPPVGFAGSSPGHLLGTDNLGRDVTARLLYGARPAVLVMLVGATLSGIIGSVLGLVAGYFGGWVDGVISRIVEVFMSFPPMLLAIVLAAVIGPGLTTVVAAVVLVGWTRFCRVIRGEVIAMRELDFVTTARTFGVRPIRLLYHELLPNLLPILGVLFSLEMGRAIIVEAVLSFIGFSSSDLPTWGGMIADGRSYANQAWWVMAIPIVCVGICVLALNALGDGLRAALDPLARR